MKRVVLAMIPAISLYAGGITLPDHFKAEFKQTITNPKGKRIDYSGTIRFSAPSLMKWAYRKPTRKEVCTDGKALTVVDHDLEEATRYRMDRGFNFNAIVKEAKHHRDHIYVAHYLGHSYTIQTDRKERIQSVAYYDDLDNKVQIIFLNIKYGKGALPYRKMVCSIPKAYDILGE
jgi:outer membrane lipoprotein carrier protein